MAVAVFQTSSIVGNAVATPFRRGCVLVATFTRLPPGKHGFHIHVAGDLRGEGCAGACEHLHLGPPSSHGDAPRHKTRRSSNRHSANRHSGDLGNIQLRGAKTTYKYILPDVPVHELYGRTLIVHADEDDLGRGNEIDSHTTGHSGKRIGCAIFGRAAPCAQTRQTRSKKRRMM